MYVEEADVEDIEGEGPEKDVDADPEEKEVGVAAEDIAVPCAVP